MKLSIIIPLLDEEKTITQLYKRLISSLKKDFKKFKYEIIFVDDGSSDKTFQILKKLHNKDKNLKIIQFSRNFGHHLALTAGIDYATGDYIVMMDGDLQDKPEEIINLYKKLKKGYDIVYARRMNKNFGVGKKISSFLFNKLISFLADKKIVINSTVFRIFTKQVAREVKQMRESNRYLLGLFGWVGFRHAIQKVGHGKRFGGKTKYSMSRQIELAFNAIISFSDYPLKLITKIGFFFVFLSVLMIFYILIKKLIYNTPIVGWSSLIFSIFAIGGIQIILLGVIGEYLGRSYMESKKRSLYVIKNLLS